MKTNYKLLCLALILCFTAKAQMSKWCIPPYLVDFSGPNPLAPSLVATTLPTGSYPTASNAAFDKNGNMLFYVRSGQIANSSGLVINSFPVALSLEISIVPVPGNCTRYYVIGIGYDISGGPVDLYYSMVETSGGISIVPGFNNVNLGTVGAGKAGLAVSKLRPDKTRFLFTVGGGSVNKFQINNNGIDPGLSIYNCSWLGQNQACDVELKENPATGTMKLAWGQTTWTIGVANYVHVLNLTSAGSFSSLNNYAIPGLRGVYGLEFFAYGTKLVVGQTSSTNGIAIIDLSTSAVSFIPSSVTYAGSQIETAGNGKIYVLSTSNELALIDAGAGTITNTSLTLTSYSGIFESTLPDQVDDEDYAVANFRPQLMARDNASDLLGIEPNQQAHDALDMWASPDLWNRRNSPASSEVHEEPGYGGLGNLMKMKVRNIGCTTSNPSYVKMYWTLASTGEIWSSSWNGVQTINSVSAGGEITTNSTYSTYSAGHGYPVPAIAPGDSTVIYAKWFPTPPATYASPLVPSDAGICLLGRIVDPIQDPMYNEQLYPAIAISQNVYYNNNIVTRNTALINESGSFKVSPGPRKERSVLVQNYLGNTQTFDIKFAALTQIDAGYSNLGTVTLRVDDDIWYAWLQSNQQTMGLTLSNSQTHEFTVTDLTNAVLKNISMNAGDNMRVTLGFSLNNPTQVTNTYRFAISQERTNWQQGDEKYGSTCNFFVSINGVDDQDTTGWTGQDSTMMQNQNFTSTGIQSIDNKSASAERLFVYPNPSTNEAFVRLTLADQETVLAVKITDISGKVVKEITDYKYSNKTEQSVPIITSDLRSGMYIINIQTTKGIRSAKMSVLH